MVQSMDMRRLLRGVLFAAIVIPLGANAATHEVTFRSADGVTVYGTFHAVRSSKPTIVLFHQADSSRHEYDAITPRLNAAGYATLAIDQRSGGTLFGKNETMQAFTTQVAYPSALPDMEAAVAWAVRRSGGPVIVWGSSYSSSLVFVLAAKHPRDVRAVIAFSPGEYFDGKPGVAAAAAHIDVPIFVDSAANAEEISAAKAILAASPSHRKVQYVPTAGVHGSSTLLPAKDPSGAAANWNAVLAFLKDIG
jgi:dienelactone hydrolase